MIWDLNSAKIYPGLLWSDQWQTVRAASPGETGWNLWGVSLQSQKYCLCVCAYMLLSVHVCLSVHHSVPVGDPARAYAASGADTLLIDRERNMSARTNDATALYCDSQIQFHFSTSFTSWLSACRFRSPVGQFVILTNTSKRAGQQTLPRNSTVSKGVCFTFNDAHIRELGGSLLPLSPHASAPDYSLASDSQWWMA